MSSPSPSPVALSIEKRIATYVLPKLREKMDGSFEYVKHWFAFMKNRERWVQVFLATFRETVTGSLISVFYSIPLSSKFTFTQLTETPHVLKVDVDVIQLNDGEFINFASLQRTVERDEETGEITQTYVEFVSGGTLPIKQQPPPRDTDFPPIGEAPPSANQWPRGPPAGRAAGPPAGPPAGRPAGPPSGPPADSVAADSVAADSVANKKVARLEKQCEELQKELAERDATIQELIAKLAERDAAIQELSTVTETLRAKLAKRDAEMCELRAVAGPVAAGGSGGPPATDAKVAKLKKEREMLREEREGLREALTAAKCEISGLTGKLEAMTLYEKRAYELNKQAIASGSSTPLSDR
jgi:hypothetical protein